MHGGRATATTSRRSLRREREREVAAPRDLAGPPPLSSDTLEYRSPIGRRRRRAARYAMTRSGTTTIISRRAATGVSYRTSTTERHAVHGSRPSQRSDRSPPITRRTRLRPATSAVISIGSDFKLSFVSSVSYTFNKTPNRRPRSTSRLSSSRSVEEVLVQLGVNGEAVHSRSTPAGLPMATVSIRIPRSAAVCAAFSGSGFSLFSPSHRSTTTAGAWTPAGTGRRCRRLRRAIRVVVGRWRVQGDIDRADGREDPLAERRSLLRLEPVDRRRTATGRGSGSGPRCLRR